MTRYIAGLFDEHEFMRQLPPHYGFVAFGPYDTVEEAQEKARTLSTDPDEAVVVELVEPEYEPCPALIRHGPGHMSTTECELTGPHEIHRAIYGSMRQEATWRGAEVFSGFFDEPPWADDEEEA